MVPDLTQLSGLDLHGGAPSAVTLTARIAHGLSSDKEERRAQSARLTQMWSEALTVWKDVEAAGRFLVRPHPMLEDRMPVDVVIQSAASANLVSDILRRLKHGSAA
ncbi:DUF2384 domain-containing protein [Tistrella bauzanensis]|uniref:antitoxin Xre/MbcA/ParS toxin-binding domain-containing protein n=1 Tax=Tistrella bauzanensis TaxID=657419 RepID=UPI001E389B15|nr:antitoxin Xre/MbcA/ParS toxin-binding domain-containing protein [Tistrella bauzanensis]